MRPSAMGLAAKCPASVTLKGYGSEQAQNGTAFHELAKMKVLNEPLDYEMIQKKYNLADDSMKDIKFGINNIEINIPDGVVIHAEEFIKSPSMNLSGTPDLFLDFSQLGENKMTLVDWKNGRMEVSSPDSNFQLLSYAVILFENNPHIESMHIVIMQTRLNQMSESIIDRDKAMKIKEVLRGIIERAECANPEFIKGSWCGGCFVCLECPAFAGQYLALANQIEPREPKDLLDDKKIPDALRLLLPIAKRASSVADNLIDLARAYVDRFGSLDIGDGTWFCKVASTRKKLDPGKAMPILREYFEEDSNKLINLSASKIYDMARAKSKGLNKEINLRLEQAGAFISEDKIEYRILKQVQEITKLTKGEKDGK
jgi:CRISPR/Cas system-associated exonuclease Cas4 (RecB family)